MIKEMPANVDSMFSVREMPWHREGTVVEDYPGDWAEARKLAGLDWDPVRVPTAKWVPGPSGSMVISREGKDETGSWQEDPNWSVVVRDDTGDTLFHVRDSLNLITNTEMGEIIEAILATDKNIKWETGGVLEGGRLVWILVTLDEPVTIPGDRGTYTLPYMAVTNRHDGWGACVLRSTAVRIVCANTWRAAEAEGENTGATYRFVHRGKWQDRLEDARNAVTATRKEFQDYLKLSEELLGIKVNANQRELFVRAFIPKPPDGLITDRVSRNVDEARDAIRAILNSETTAKVKGTAYGLAQAGGEYLDHVRRAKSWETKLGRTLIQAEPGKQRAVSLAREVALADVTKASLPA